MKTMIYTRISVAILTIILGLAAAYHGHIGLYPGFTIWLVCLTVYAVLGLLLAEATNRMWGSRWGGHLVMFTLWLPLLIFTVARRNSPANDG